MVYCKKCVCFLTKETKCCYDCEHKEGCPGRCKESIRLCGEALIDRSKKVSE